MKILTLNCHSWQEENQLKKIKYLAKIINENNYDVIAMQEVSQSIDSDIVYENIKEDNFALLLNEELKNIGNYSYDFFWDMAHIGYEIYEEGLCLMTKLPICNKKRFTITNNNDVNFWKSRNLVKLNVKYEDKIVSFYSCHMGWWNDKEEPFINQVKNLMQDVAKEDLAFVMGDFNNNANIRNEGYDYICENLFDTYNLAKEKDEGTTVKGKIAGWDDNEEKLRIDLVFVNKKVDVLSSNVIFNNVNKSTISDHYGVEVNINI